MCLCVFDQATPNFVLTWIATLTLNFFGLGLKVLCSNFNLKFPRALTLLEFCTKVIFKMTCMKCVSALFQSNERDV